LSWLLTRRIARLSIQKGADLSQQLADEIKTYYLGPLGVSTAPNTFQWSIARLTLRSPEARAVVQRFEADSKFFRSLFVVPILTVALEIVQLKFLPAFVGTGLLILSLWRYVDQRSKAVNRAYWFIFTLESEISDGYSKPDFKSKAD
jgi:hypothetical protein